MDRSGPVRTLFTVDLFTGAGGLALGFADAGFHPLAANDFDATVAATFAANFQNTPFLLRPIERVPGQEFLSIAGLQSGQIDAVLGGPPCQAFSVYNHQRGFHDDRSGLFREYLRIVGEVQPKVVVMENVVGMTSLDGGRAIDEIHRSLGKLGYRVEHRILRAEEYGVPQERRRIFFVGSRVGPIIWPEPTHGRPDDLLTAHLDRLVTVWDAIGDLPKLEMGEGSDEVMRYTRLARNTYQAAMREGSDGVRNHYAPQLMEINVKRMRHIPQGGSWRNLPHELLPAGMKRARRSDHTKRYGRLHPDGLFSTILTKADLHWGAYIHPVQDRTLSVRECARAQSFPDRFRFVGSRSEQYRQVGNAVPPLLARMVATSVRKMIELAKAGERPAGRLAVGA
jgi:DNA (cytosine-5)-methyltransferase 1